MGLIEGLSGGLSALFLNPLAILAVLSGAMVGLASGALPATGLPGIIVLISVAYYMDPVIAIALAMGMAAPVHSSDTLPSVLLGVPGSVSSQATILDGYPMARQGRAGEALGAAYLGSLIGGLIGALVIAASIPFARALVNAFASPEFLVMGLMGIAVVAVVSSGAVFKGLLAGAVGMGVAAIGTDPALGYPRFVPFSFPYLMDGVNIITVVIGIFAIPELMGLIIEDRSIAKADAAIIEQDINLGRWEGMRAVLRHKFLVVRSVFLGVLVGIMPGIGGSVVDWLTYAQARVTEKGADKTFGTGDIRGVIAPESANNATSAAQLIPTLAVGIPGGAYMAIYLGFFIILGLQPGPAMLNHHLDIMFLIVFSLILANVFGTIVLLFMSNYFARLAFIRPHVLVPLILSILVLAAFTSKNSLWDLTFLGVFSLIGWHMKRHGWARPPLIIGFVLGPILERYLTISLSTYTVPQLLMRPWSLAIVMAGVLIGLYGMHLSRKATQAWSAARSSQPNPASRQGVESSEGTDALKVPSAQGEARTD